MFQNGFPSFILFIIGEYNTDSKSASELLEFTQLRVTGGTRGPFCRGATEHSPITNLFLCVTLPGETVFIIGHGQSMACPISRNTLTNCVCLHLHKGTFRSCAHRCNNNNKKTWRLLQWLFQQTDQHQKTLLQV